MHAYDWEGPECRRKMNLPHPPPPGVRHLRCRRLEGASKSTTCGGETLGLRSTMGTHVSVDKVDGAVVEERDLEGELASVFMPSHVHPIPLHCEPLI